LRSARRRPLSGAARTRRAVPRSLFARRLEASRFIDVWPGLPQHPSVV
jgi:hypothetical protein